MNIPKADAEGWFNVKECKPPVGRTVEVRTGEKLAEAYFSGTNWICVNQEIPQPEFWRLRK